MDDYVNWSLIVAFFALLILYVLLYREMKRSKKKKERTIKRLESELSAAKETILEKCGPIKRAKE